MARRSPPVPALVVAAVLAALVTALVLSLVAGDEDRPEPITVDEQAGDPPPHDIAGTAVPHAPYERLADGTSSDLEALRGERPAVVNFFGSWCPPCITEMPGFEEVHQRLGDRVAFLGLAERDTVEDARRIVEDTGVTYETGRDLNGVVLTALAVAYMPTTVFVAADGTVTSAHTGPMEADELEGRIRAELLP